MYKVILLRHGESRWNKENRFTGWTDVDLSEKGTREAEQAGKVLKKEGYQFDIAYTSVLKRAIRTLWIALSEMNQMWIPVHRSWRLNEKHYGALQGLNKKEKAKEVGEEQVFRWRRVYDCRPPALEKDDKRHPNHDRRYHGVKNIPATECLKDTVARVLPYWKKTIVPDIKKGRSILISAHGNSLRALVKHLDNIPDDEIPHVNIPTGIPLVYELDPNLNPIKNYYIGDDKAVKEAMKKVRNQGKS